MYKYQNLKDNLRELIAGMQPGERLESENELCARYGVSRTTVRKALNDLAQEGIIYSRQGKGTFATSVKVNSGWVQRTAGFLADMAERGVEVSWQMLDHSTEPANDVVAQALRLEPGQLVARFVRLRFIEGRPYDLCTNYLPLRLFPDILERQWPEHSLYTLLRVHYGVNLAQGVRTVEVGQCPAEEARLLGIRTGAPLLVLRSTMYDQRSRPVEHGIAHQRGDRARIVIDVLPK